MNKYDFTNLVKSPKTIGEADMEKLKGLVSQFPYFSVAQNLLVKALHNTHHYEYEKFLKQAALQAGNRSVLYNLVHDLPLETDSDIHLNQSVETLQFQNNVEPNELVEKMPVNLAEAENTVVTLANDATKTDTKEIEKPIVEESKMVSNAIEGFAKDSSKITASEIPTTLSTENFNEEDFAAKLAEANTSIAPDANNWKEEIVFSEPPVSEPLKAIETAKTETPIIEAAKVRENLESSKVEVPLAKLIEKEEPEKDPNIIYEDEKLVRPMGDFEKFIPKNFELGVDEYDSLITIGDDADDVLGNFDISSLDSFVPARPIPEEDEWIERSEDKAIEPKLENIEEVKASVSLLQEVVSQENILENKLTTNEEKIESQISLENTPAEAVEPADSDFFKWLSQKEESSLPLEENNSTGLKATLVDTPKEAELSQHFDTALAPITNEVESVGETTAPLVEPTHPDAEATLPIVEPAKPIMGAPMVEDERFVFDFNLAISQQANSKLSDTIQGHLDKEIAVKEVRIEPTHEHATVVQQSHLFNPLQSLIDYEVNEYLAPLYKQVSYNEHLFENDFIETYGGKSEAKFNFDEPFVRLKPLVDEVKPAVNKELEIEAPINEKVFSPIEQVVEISPEKKTELSREEIQKLANKYHISEEVEGDKEEKKTVLSREEIQKLANQYHISEEIEGSKEEKNKVENREIEKAKKESLVQPKIAELPTPKIARDPGTVESILDKFIRENPSIARPKSEFYSPVNMAKQSAEESAEIVSETLAQIYTRQGLYKKAIVMYEKLGLHYPDKFTYFAGLISQIKSAHNIE